jgi:hypothetical protein
MATAPRPALLLVGGDDDLAYLLERYARRRGLELVVADRPVMADRSVNAHGPGRVDPAVIWFASVNALAGVTPIDGADGGVPLIVSAAAGEEEAAIHLGADYCALHPLTYRDFVNALASVGVGDDGQSDAVH